MKFFLKFSKIATIAASLLLTACTWPTTLVKTDEVHTPSSKNRGWLVIPANVVSDNNIYNRKSCSLIVTPGFNKYDVNFEMLEHEKASIATYSLVELRAGTYEIMEIYCGSARGNLQFMGLARFNVFPGKISVLAGLHIHIDEHLTMTKFNYSSLEEQPVEIKYLLQKIRPEERTLVVSAYTEEPLVPNLENTIAVPEGMKKSKRFTTAMNKCYREEAVHNPLLIGALKFEWGPSGNDSLKMGHEMSMFTSEMKHCLYKAVDAFIQATPGSAGTAWL